MRIVGGIVGGRFRLCAAKFFGMMVARDGVRTADAGLFRPSSTYTINNLQVCGELQLPANTCKAYQSRAGITG